VPAVRSTSRNIYFALSPEPLLVPDVPVEEGCSSMHFSRSWPVILSQRPVLVLPVEPVAAGLAAAPLALVSDDALSEFVPVVAEPEVPAPCPGLWPEGVAVEALGTLALSPEPVLELDCVCANDTDAIERSAAVQRTFAFIFAS
jgi:hypothetical protein